MIRATNDDRYSSLHVVSLVTHNVLPDCVAPEKGDKSFFFLTLPF